MPGSIKPFVGIGKKGAALEQVAGAQRGKSRLSVIRKEIQLNCHVRHPLVVAALNPGGKSLGRSFGDSERLSSLYGGNIHTLFTHVKKKNT